MTLYLGDCLQVLPKLADDSVNLVCADLPYGITDNKWDTAIPFAPLWGQLLRIGKANAAFVFTARQPFTTSLINSQPKLFRYDLVWEKGRANSFMHAKFMPLLCHESVLVFSRALANASPLVKNRIPYTPLMTPGRPYRTISNGLSTNYNKGLRKCVIESAGGRYPRSVIYFNVGKDAGLHPTQKPVALFEWLIKTYSHPGDTILDPVMGSGTAGVASINTGRKFIGIEKEPKYFEIAQQRISAAHLIEANK